ncbi:hypothetical protein D3C81_1417230 [compost metagenome]
MLIIMKYGNIQLCGQPPFNLKAARRTDILQIDSAEAGGNRFHYTDDLLWVFRVQAERKSINVRQLLEQHRLTLHNRHCRLWADIA